MRGLKIMFDSTEIDGYTSISLAKSQFIETERMNLTSKKQLIPRYFSSVPQTHLLALPT